MIHQFSSNAGHRRWAALLAAVAAFAGSSAVSNAQTSGVVPVASQGRAAVDNKGSLLIWSWVEVKWDASGNVIRDTFLQLTNDFPGEIKVQMYFVNGDPPLAPVFDNGRPPMLIERGHEGWNWVDTQVTLTGDQPTNWVASSGQPLGVPMWSLLDPGNPAGRPDLDPDNLGGRIVRGYVFGWAVNDFSQEIRWNHLFGNAVVVDYRSTSAAEYPAWSFQAHSAAHGQSLASCIAFNLESGQCVDSRIVPGRLDLDGYEYDNPPGRLSFAFNTVGSVLTNGAPGWPAVGVESELVLFPTSTDLRQDNDGPVTTKAKFDIWNENEVRFSGTERCLTCWDKTALEDYVLSPRPNHFLMSVIQTTTGKARVGGMESTVCDGSATAPRDAALLGIMLRTMRFPTGTETTAVPLVGQGDEVAQILYDVIAPPDEQHGE